MYRLAAPYAAKYRWPAGFSAETTLTGATLRLDLSDRAQLVAFMLGGYALDSNRYIASRLPAHGTFFDVGAHVGMLSFPLAVAWPGASIHAFEPNADNAARWRVNQALNPNSHTSLTEAAVSDHIGTLRFDVPWDSVTGMATPDGDRVVRSVTIDGYCAEHHIDHIDVLKIDVQGGEPAVLRGARRMLGEGRVDTVLCEVDESLLAMAGEDATGILGPLEEHGFRKGYLPNTGLSRFLPSSAETYDLTFER
jgi:FkbM family methyltransferase